MNIFKTSSLGMQSALSGAYGNTDSCKVQQRLVYNLQWNRWQRLGYVQGHDDTHETFGKAAACFCHGFRDTVVFPAFMGA